jgi:hypothetical protein
MIARKTLAGCLCPADGGEWFNWTKGQVNGGVSRADQVVDVLWMPVTKTEMTATINCVYSGALW